MLANLSAGPVPHLCEQLCRLINAANSFGQGRTRSVKPSRPIPRSFGQQSSRRRWDGHSVCWHDCDQCVDLQERDAEDPAPQPRLNQGAFRQAAAAAEAEGGLQHSFRHDPALVPWSRLRSEEMPALAAVKAANPPAIRPALMTFPLDKLEASV